MHTPCLVWGVRDQLLLLEAALDAPAEERQVEGAGVALRASSQSRQPSPQRTRDTQLACRGTHPVSWWSCRRRLKTEVTGVERGLTHDTLASPIQQGDTDISR